jgi:hypothetical protein
MALGRADTMARREEVMNFFGWQPHHRRRTRPAMVVPDTNALHAAVK